MSTPRALTSTSSMPGAWAPSQTSRMPLGRVRAEMAASGICMPVMVSTTTPIPTH